MAMQGFYIIDFDRRLWVYEGVCAVKVVDDFNNKHEHRADLWLPAERCYKCGIWVYPSLDWFMEVRSKGISFCSCKKR